MEAMTDACSQYIVDLAMTDAMKGRVAVKEELMYEVEEMLCIAWDDSIVSVYDCAWYLQFNAMHGLYN